MPIIASISWYDAQIMIEPGAVVAVRSPTAYRNTSFVSWQALPVYFPFEGQFLAGYYTSTCQKQLKVQFDGHNHIIVLMDHSVVLRKMYCRDRSQSRTRVESVRKPI